MTEPNELLEAVDALTNPTRTQVIQSKYETVMINGRPKVDDNGDIVRVDVGTETTKIHHDPLLDQMEAAVRGELNTVESGGESLKFTRGILDSDALYHLMRIGSTIRDWSRMIDAPRRDTLSAQLRAWYVKYTQDEQNPASIRSHTRTIDGWVNLIRDKIDPHDESVRPEFCPNPDCPQGTDEHTGRPIWWDPKTRSSVTDPLIVTFRRTDGPDMVKNATARCRACGTVWTARALAWDLEHAEPR